MTYQNQRGGRQGSGQEPRQMTPNEQISLEETYKQFLQRLNEYRGQVEAVLPSTVTFEKFRAVVVMAVRREPKLLECYPPSLINACLHSAHDGLLPDGREAVIVWTYSGKNRRLEASYRSMVRGLINQILACGKVDAIKAIIVYANEPFRIIEGSDPKIEHEVSAIDGERGDPIGCYTRAHLASGLIVTEYMTQVQIEKIRAIAQTDDVWKNHWEEMAKKTVIRRHRKSLPGTSHIIDMEEREMFPQFAREPAPSIGTPRPTRQQFAQARLESGGDMGVALDTGGDLEREKIPADEREPAQTQRKAKAEPRESKGKPGGGAFDYAAWRDALIPEIATLTKLDAVNTRWKAERPTIADAPKEIAREINTAFNDRLVDLTAGNSSAAAGPDDDDDQSSAGDRR